MIYMQQNIKDGNDRKPWTVFVSVTFRPAGVWPTTAAGNQTGSRYTGSERLREHVKEGSL